MTDALKQWQQAEHEVVGDYVERVCWQELNVEDGSRFMNWLGVLKANGLRGD